MTGWVPIKDFIHSICKIYCFRQERFKKTGKELKIGRQRHSIRQKTHNFHLKHTYTHIGKATEVRLAVYNG